MNAELTAENNPAYAREKSVFTVELRVQRTCRTHEDRECVQVLIILLRVLTLGQTRRTPRVYGKKVGAWDVRSQ